MRDFVDASLHALTEPILVHGGHIGHGLRSGELAGSDGGKLLNEVDGTRVVGFGLHSRHNILSMVFRNSMA